MSYDGDKFMERAKQIDAEARRRWDAVNADTMLTPQGKAPKLAEVDQWRRGQVDALQHEAHLAIGGRKADLYTDIRQRREAAAAAERKLLGDSISFSLAERELAAAETDDLPRAVEKARDEWERAVLSRLAWLEAQRRGKGERESVALQKIQAMLVTPDDGELKRMEQERDYLDRSGDGLIADLDRRAYANRVGAALGVNPDKMQ